MGSFDVLVRLAKQAVDQERQVLVQINRAIAEAEEEIEDLDAIREKEAENGSDFMTTGATLSAYLFANKQRVRSAMQRMQALQVEHGLQLGRLKQQRIELKRYELLAERRAERAADEAAAKEQKIIDELATRPRRRPADG